MKKIPVIIQLETLECGAASLGMILASYGKWVTLEQLRKDCGISRDGSRASNILKAARNYGMDAKGFRCEADQVINADETIFPCIAFWQNRHFIVVRGVKNGYVYVNDPEIGSVKLSVADFTEGFSKVILTMTPGVNFKKEGKRESILSFAYRRLSEHKKTVIITLICYIAASVLSAAAAILSQRYIDSVLPGLENLGTFLILLITFNVLQIIFLIINVFITYKTSSEMASKGSSDFMWKVIKLPMEFFAQRTSGDIHKRRSENAEIAETFINCLTPLLIDGVMMIFYFVIMIQYSPILTLIGLILEGLSVLSCRIVTGKSVNISRKSTIDDAKLYSYTLSGIEMFSNIKSTGSEKAFIKKWSSFRDKLDEDMNQLNKLNSTLGMLPMFFENLASASVLCAGILLVTKGQFTVGAIMVFQSFLESFAEPINSFMDANQILHETRTQMERVEDVLKFPKDKAFDYNIKSEEYKKLDGNITLNNITFSYSPLSSPIIKNLNLEIKQGESVAIVGGSGCGKSTLSKIISGLYVPQEGEVLFSGKLLHDIDPLTFRASLAVVDQDIILFEDTVANNIKMWDHSIEDFEMILAAKDAQIHEEIMARPTAYESMVRENGGNFSGGQRQRLEIARVLAQDPSIVIFDEATSALDAETEFQIVKNIKARGITSIVIAHRLSAIRDCDRIVVLNKGQIEAIGTHKELFNSCQIYKDLVSNE